METRSPRSRARARPRRTSSSPRTATNSATVVRFSRLASSTSVDVRAPAGEKAGDLEKYQETTPAVPRTAPERASAAARRLRADLLEELHLPVLGLGDGHRVLAGEAGRAVPVALGIVDRGQHALVREVGQAVRADALAD